MSLSEFVPGEYVFMAATLLFNMASQRHAFAYGEATRHQCGGVAGAFGLGSTVHTWPGGAANLADSEPTFPSTESHVEDSGEVSLNSLAGYSPSPDRSPITRRGFNLLVPDGLSAEGMHCSYESEQIAKQALLDRWLWEEDLMALALHLPSCTRSFQRSLEFDTSCSFLMGAYIHGCSAGLLNNSRSFPLVTALITSVIRSVAPQVWYSSAGISLNIRSHAHKDSNNSSVVQNTIIPASDFQNGELWLEDCSGQHEVEGRLGRLVPVERPFICFNPRVRHATQPWLGNRLVIIGYHVRNAEYFSAADKTELCGAGFRLYEGR